MAKKGPKSSEPGFQVCAICATLARRFRKGKTFLLNFVQRKTLSGRAINDDGDVCSWPSSNVGGLWGICTSSPAVTALRALCTAHLITLLCSTVTDWIAQCFKANLHWQWRPLHKSAHQCIVALQSWCTHWITGTKTSKLLLSTDIHRIRIFSNCSFEDG